MSPQICLPVSFHVVRQEGDLLLCRNQRLQRAPRSPARHKGSIVCGALNAPACHHVQHRLASLMSPLWEWPFVAGSGHTARAKAPFPSLSVAAGTMGSSPCAFPFCCHIFSNERTPPFCTFQNEEGLFGSCPSWHWQASLSLPLGQFLLWGHPPPLPPCLLSFVPLGSLPRSFLANRLVFPCPEQ